MRSETLGNAAPQSKHTSSIGCDPTWRLDCAGCAAAWDCGSAVTSARAVAGLGVLCAAQEEPWDRQMLDHRSNARSIHGLPSLICVRNLSLSHAVNTCHCSSLHTSSGMPRALSPGSHCKLDLQRAGSGHYMASVDEAKRQCHGFCRLREQGWSQRSGLEDRHVDQSTDRWSAASSRAHQP